MSSREPSEYDLSLAASDENADVHVEGLDVETHSKPRVQRTTDLVRLYLQEIGRVSLLERDEEVAEAQRVQQHMELLALRDQAAEQAGGTLATYVNLLNTRDQLTAQLSHRPSLERWATVAGILARRSQADADRGPASLGRASWAQCGRTKSGAG